MSNGSENAREGFSRRSAAAAAFTGVGLGPLTAAQAQVTQRVGKDAPTGEVAGATTAKMEIPAANIARVESSARLVQLDFLRGVAILLVLTKHSSGLLLAAWPSRPLKYIFVPAYYLGPTGVDLFFVLSGFLVGGLLLKQFSETSKPDLIGSLYVEDLRSGPRISFSFCMYSFS